MNTIERLNANLTMYPWSHMFILSRESLCKESVGAGITAGTCVGRSVIAVAIPPCRTANDGRSTRQ